MKSKTSLLTVRNICSILFCLTVTLGLFLTTAKAQAQSNKIPDVHKIDVFLQQAVLRCRIPGLAVVVVRNDEILFMKGYGQAAHNQPVTPHTQFYIGSNNKSFIALAVLQLVEQGKIELDAPVQRYIPWFEVADSQASRQITVRHLLNHTSGLSETGDPGSMNFSPTLIKQIRHMRKARLTAPVGSKYQYNSQNYRVLGLIVETVSGQTFTDYLHENILTPLGMTQTVINPEQAADLAQGHSQFLGFPLPRTQAYQPAGLPMISSVEDIGKYMIVMLDQGAYNGQKLVQPQSFSQLITPPQGIESEYGMGWASMTTPGGRQLIYMGGSLANYASMIMMLPQENVGIAFLSNQYGIIPMLTSLSIVKSGLLALLEGNPAPQDVSFNWLYCLLGTLITLDLGVQLYRFFRLPRWLKNISTMPRLLRWLSVCFDLIIPLLVLLGLPALINLTMGGSGNWSLAYDLIPDVTLWIITSMTLCLLRGVIKLIKILRWQRSTTVLTV